jgi:peroxiredoxin
MLYPNCLRRFAGVNRRMMHLLWRRIDFILFIISMVGTPAAWSAKPEELLLPQNLLKLVHASEVHRELQFNDQQSRDLELLFQEIDGPWFRSRNLPQDKQHAIVQELESRVWDWSTQHLESRQQKRLRELLYQSEGTRLFLRKELHETLDLSPAQVSAVVSAAIQVTRAEQDLHKATQAAERIDSLQKKLTEAREKENEIVAGLLTPVRRSRVSELLGKDFDTQSLRRVYPMAPELEPATDWINSSPLTLKSLRGKVVIIHYYAFQCHNCHANFAHYIRWSEQYKDKDAVVIGIQTPETQAESDPEKVRSAALEKNLQFPILIDIERSNWNAWGNTMWPTVYVVDRNGYLRYWWQGELNWRGATGDTLIEKIVDELLAE